MQRNSHSVESHKTFIYLLAGVATAPLFMETIRIALHDRLTKLGESVHSELLFPYGDWSRRVIPQVWEIKKDMRLGFQRLERSIGGNRVLASIESQLIAESGCRIILIGHSAGGVAAVHAAQLLLEKQVCSKPCSVVMIGSPRIRIPEPLKRSILSLHAIGKNRDLISRLGTFGGWQAGLGRIPVWRADKHAPDSIQVLSLLGGHPDYFRDQAPFINQQGKSNLELTLEAIVQWLSVDSAK
jgi:pimeloyl-ACP methyl ester carboxylesterase